MNVVLTNKAIELIKKSKKIAQGNIIANITYVTSIFDEIIECSLSENDAIDYESKGYWTINWCRKSDISEKFIKRYHDIEVVFEYASGDPNKNEALIDYINGNFSVTYR